MGVYLNQGNPTRVGVLLRNGKKERHCYEKF